MKKVEIGLIIIVTALLLIIVSSAILLRERKPTTAPTLPIQFFSPSPKPSLLPSVPQELEAEKISQENYAKSRAEFFQTHPWVLNMPLKTVNYFISYDSGTDSLIVELYYSENNTIDKGQQLAQAKQDAINAMISIGIDVNQQKIEYMELLKKQ